MKGTLEKHLQVTNLALEYFYKHKEDVDCVFLVNIQYSFLYTFQNFSNGSMVIKSVISWSTKIISNLRKGEGNEKDIKIIYVIRGVNQLKYINQSDENPNMFKCTIINQGVRQTNSNKLCFSPYRKEK